MYRRGDLGQVARALRVLDALRGFKQGRWVSEVAAEVGASERTVRRDIAELQDAGFDIEVSRRDNRSFACLATERTYSPVSITKRERFTLLAVRSVFDVLQGTPFLDDVRSVMTKLEQRMSDKERAEVATFGERFVYMPDHGTKSYDGKEDVIDALQTGMLSRKLVRFRYASARGRGKQGYLAPFAMALYRHGLYVVGARLDRAEDDVARSPLEVFAVERFADAEHLRDRSFAMPDVRVHEQLHGAFGPHIGEPDMQHEVVVEFSREKAVLVASRTWHREQRIETLRDGRVRLSFTVPNMTQVRSWILEWGPHARVIGPPALVEQVRSELEQALAAYQTRPGS